MTWHTYKYYLIAGVEVGRRGATMPHLYNSRPLLKGCECIPPYIYACLYWYISVFFALFCLFVHIYTNMYVWCMYVYHEHMCKYIHTPKYINCRRISLFGYSCHWCLLASYIDIHVYIYTPTHVFAERKHRIGLRGTQTYGHQWSVVVTPGYKRTRYMYIRLVKCLNI
jgi:hypothetical protein